MRDAALIQVGTGGGWGEVLGLLEPHHAAYCERHGFDWRPVYDVLQTERHPIWDKVVATWEALEAGYQWVVLLDADVLIVRPEVDLRTALHFGDLGMVSHALPVFHLSAGAVWMRNTERVREFYLQVWNFDYLADWPECSPPLGTRDGDQHSMNRVLEQRDFDLLEILPAWWHSAAHVNPARDPILKAWHGVGGIDDRRAAIAAELERLG